MGDIVKDIKKFTQGWQGGLPETPCGSGSTLKNTAKQRVWIPQMLRKYKIKSIADIGAGDLNWLKETKIPKTIEYKAYDLVPRLAEVNKFNIVEDTPPKVDLIMCLWVLNHLTYEQCQKALSNLLNSKAKYLMMTDRPKWHHEQPKEIQMEAIETLVLNDKKDSIKLVKL